MTVEEALLSALDFEHRVRDHYARAAERTSDKNTKRIFASFAVEEQIHVDYLKTALINWKNDNTIYKETLETSVPDKEWIEKGWNKLNGIELKGDFKSDLDMLREALALESAVSDHFKLLVDQLDGEAQSMFHQFLEMEEHHLAIIGAIVDLIECDNILMAFPVKSTG